jgi:hypothetical protein
MLFIEFTEHAWERLLHSDDVLGAAAMPAILQSAGKVMRIRWPAGAFVLVQCSAGEAMVLLASCERLSEVMSYQGVSREEVARMAAAADAVRAGLQRGER